MVVDTNEPFPVHVSGGPSEWDSASIRKLVFFHPWLCRAPGIRYRRPNGERNGAGNRRSSCPHGHLNRSYQARYIKEKQIVLTWDDARRMIILDGFLDPEQPSVLHREIELQNVQSNNEMARLTAQSHLEMGGTYQAF